MKEAYAVRRTLPLSAEVHASIGQSFVTGGLRFRRGRDRRARAGARLRSTPIYERLPLCWSSLTTSPEAGHPPGVELSGVNIDRSLGQRPFTVT